MTFSNQFVTTEIYRSIIIHTICKLGHFIAHCHVYMIDVFFTVPYTEEVKTFRVLSPLEFVHVRFEIIANKHLFASFTIHHTQAVPVAFITIASHALPSNIFSIGRILRIDIIAGHFSLSSFAVLFAKVYETSLL